MGKVNYDFGENFMIKVTLAHKYKDSMDPTGWLMSEKLDGVRAYWDGEHLTSRLGNPFQAPEWFTQGLPKDIKLDGELWLGRGKFQKTVGIVKSHLGNSDWHGIQYKIFDMILDSTDTTSRQTFLRHLKLPKHAQIVTQRLCLNKAHLKGFEYSVLEGGGEGVMLRNPTSYYEYKRTKNLLKVKRFVRDTAIVRDYQEGLGKYVGLVGALICMWNAKIIVVGSGMSDEERQFPPALGTEIKFKYFQLTDAGMPRHPVYKGVV